MTEPAIRTPIGPLADGEWHRLHPASPLLRGGLVLIAVLGFVLANLRERIVEVFVLFFAPGAEAPGGTPDFGGDWAEDPVTGIVAHGLLGWALLGLLVVVALVVLAFWFAWRMHTFRVTGEALEVRSGILFRSHRSARLDRIQGINIARPVFARLFGAAKLDVSVAGQSGNVDLSYLGSAQADRLRGDLLRLASGARRQESGATGDADAADGAGADDAGVAPPASGAPSVVDRAGAVVGRRVDEFLSPELDPDLAPPESVVRLPLPRVIASALLGGSMIWFVAIIVIIVVALTTGTLWMLFTFVPAAIGVVSYLWSRITGSLRYSIAGTRDGVRIGSGLLSTANQTIPPGRVHAIEASQWLLWRAFGWWTVRVNVAGQSVAQAGDAARRTLVLPVGTAADVRRVIGLLAPDALDDLAPLLDAGLAGTGPATGFTSAPRRAAWIRPFSWRRIGIAVEGGTAVLRSGWLLRRLAFVPLARMQSVAVAAGPVRRGLRLESLRIHTVAGPVAPEVPALDRADAAAAFTAIAAEAVDRALRDRSDRWGAEHAS
ncbi:PH domain-containing protein [Agromyces kandeliae]|uniref:PH domain-containing protein n=1 Tax=Agromyces kandeliae TaxID=2666141 RepID=A0A6L5R3C4_9MICO|nr:PH domain-containing protein [Agromyces kandeliae]MRX44375.1 PH domain-containing protein [Agromyces kandeliae]